MIQTRYWMGTLALLLSFFLPCSLVQAGALPISGTPVPELEDIEFEMSMFMQTNDIDGGVLGIMKDGVVVYQRGFGWADIGKQRLMLPDAMLRIASVTKPLTASAIRHLISEGFFNIDDNVFNLGQPGGGLLPVNPFPGVGDARLKNITVEDLLLHEGGWDRDTAGPGGTYLDLTYQEVTIATAMGVPSPPGRVNILDYILGQPLQNTPGTTYAYSNIGFMVLGMIAEQFSGMALDTYLQSHILAPLGLPQTEVECGRTFFEDRNAREPVYKYRCMSQNVFDPTGGMVLSPSGAWDHEARIGQGAMISSTVGMLTFLENFYISGPNIGSIRAGAEPKGWKRNHTGKLSGTSSLARQRWDGVNYVVIFNQSAWSGDTFSSQMRSIIDDVIDGAKIEWPTTSGVTDCNGNGQPDGADINSGFSSDCNANGVPDECDDLGEFEDCNDNGISDLCELEPVYRVLTDARSPIGSGSNLTFQFDSIPSSTSDVNVSFEALGDFGASSEFIEVWLNGTFMGNALTTVVEDCPINPSSESMLIPMTSYNNALQFFEDATFDLFATSNVDPNLCSCISFVRLELSYTTHGEDTDSNNDGEIDACACPDLDGDGFVGVSDLLTVVAYWSTSNAEADLNDDGIVNIQDLLFLINQWGPC